MDRPRRRRCTAASTSSPGVASPGDVGAGGEVSPAAACGCCCSWFTCMRRRRRRRRHPRRRQQRHHSAISPRSLMQPLENMVTISPAPGRTQATTAVVVSKPHPLCDVDDRRCSLLRSGDGLGPPAVLPPPFLPLQGSRALALYLAQWCQPRRSSSVPCRAATPR